MVERASRPSNPASRRIECAGGTAMTGNRKAELVARCFGRDAQNHRPEAGATGDEFENARRNFGLALCPQDSYQ